MDAQWKLFSTYTKDNPAYLVQHHIQSYNDFFATGIHKIFRENNPVRFVEREDDENECLLYLGGKDGTKIYFGKPVIYNDISDVHYMYPNDARLRNMTYGCTIHYDVDVEYNHKVGGVHRQDKHVLEKIYLGRFPIMLQSNLCILNGLPKETRFSMGECRNDYGGYFIIGGKEKVIVSQEKFADNMLYVRSYKGDVYSHSAEIRSVSEDTSKAKRTTSVLIVAPTTTYTNNQIVVDVPNIKQPVPLFILMRGLGVISDKDIINRCLVTPDLHHLFVPSIHDAGTVYTQQMALEYMAELTKKGTVTGVFEILSDYFLPHIGELNFIHKSYFVGYMVSKVIHVFCGKELETDRDQFKFKRVELSGALIYDLFREYYLLQKRNLSVEISKEYYYRKGAYLNTFGTDENNFPKLIENNVLTLFKDRIVEDGIYKGFKGNWGSTSRTKRIGVVQDMNRLSWNTFISHLRKINLPLDASAKVVGPRLLNSSQWGIIDPLDTPDGGNIGLHKHMSIMAYVSSGTSGNELMQWILLHMASYYQPIDVNAYKVIATKLFINGNWCGFVTNLYPFMRQLVSYRRVGIIPIYTSISFIANVNEVHIFTDMGRLMRPLYYVSNTKVDRTEYKSWEEYITGTIPKQKPYSSDTLYAPNELYAGEVSGDGGSITYLDTMEEETALIAMLPSNINKRTTHLEIEPSFMFGVMGNMIIYPEHNPLPRNVFSCGQSKQAVSMYHTNYTSRMDKSGLVLHYGQVPLVKSRYLQYVNGEEHPYGVNTIVAIMSYTGYNVEDAILINEGSVHRGLFKTTYYSLCETREESSRVSGMSNSRIANVEANNVVGKKLGYDYSYLDENGLVREGTELNDKIIVIGKLIMDPANKNVWIDDSVKTKKGQLGYVDKSFVTVGDEGNNVAKIRIREDRSPAIGDKMASRAGQKGTIGLLIPECDMPYTASGLKPDLIINPHAIPSRMTIGQLIECIQGMVCVNKGGFGDCTAYQTKGLPLTEIYGKELTKLGYHNTGNHLMMSGMTGEQMESVVFMGPTYYMRLKHMVKDKINYRARGPNNMLTRQAVSGRANDGGLRLGEMERDAICSHGMAYFLNDSYLTRADEYFMAICNVTGAISIYNADKKVFISPFADGPITFHTNPDGSKHVQNITKFGKSFSIIRIPYTFKLLMQELQVMNIHMKIITEDTIDQITSLAYSTNITRLLGENEDADIKTVIKEYSHQIANKLKVKAPIIEEDSNEVFNTGLFAPEYNLTVPTQFAYKSPTTSPKKVTFADDISPKYAPYTDTTVSPEYTPYTTVSPEYAPYTDNTVSPEYAPYTTVSPDYPPPSPEYAPYTDNTVSPEYAPPSPEYAPYTTVSPEYAPTVLPPTKKPIPPPMTPPGLPPQLAILQVDDKVVTKKDVADVKQISI